MNEGPYRDVELKDTPKAPLWVRLAARGPWPYFVCFMYGFVPLWWIWSLWFCATQSMKGPSGPAFMAGIGVFSLGVSAGVYGAYLVSQWSDWAKNKRKELNR